MTLLGRYENGNYTVEIMIDGTKIRTNDENSFKAAFPECMDVKITNQCDMACPYCHENSTKDGIHGNILQAKFIDTLRPFTEIAIGGGNPIAHPDLPNFLQKLADKKVIANVTVNQNHFMQNYAFVKALIDSGLITGLGVSLTDSENQEFLSKIKEIPNVVIHIINGIATRDDIKNLSCRGLKILILGYKQFRRGIQFYSPIIEKNKAMLCRLLPRVKGMFKVVSFDNLALKQLEVNRMMSAEEWNKFFMGDDGNYTMYIDLVKNEYAQCSIATTRYPLADGIDEMFATVLNA